MDRREFMRAGMVAGTAGMTGIRPSNRAKETFFYELRTYQLRNDMEPGRAQAFFKDHFIPAAKRYGAVKVGVFTPQQGMRNPSLVVIVVYPSLADVQRTIEGLESDTAYVRAMEEFENGGTYPPYERFEVSLLRAFSGHTQPEIPAIVEGKPARLYELRTYESKNRATLADKIDMFNQHEIQVFKESGMETVLFGEAVYGTNLPHLTYMVGYDNLAGRDEAWKKFGNNETWKAIRNRPGWTDPEAVSNITAVYLRPTSFSEIR